MKTVNKPDKLSLANTPTPIHKLRQSNCLPENLSVSIKRDDYTGIEVSGNKIRKLEYIVQDAIQKGETVLITCGGIQSNHCRATAAVAARLGLKAHLVLAGHESDNVGNNVLDQMFGAELTFVNPEDFGNYLEIMENIKAAYAQKGIKARTITMGASDALGSLGYFSAFEEILKQEEESGITYDTICVTVGSAGTYAGLYLGNEVYKSHKNIIGINIYDNDNDYEPIIKELVQGAFEILKNEDLKNKRLNDVDRSTGSQEGSRINKTGLNKVDLSRITLWNYAHTGYGHISDEAADLIKTFAKEQGMILDPVYTGKAFYGLLKEYEASHHALGGNVLFIHTGGMFGALARTDVYLT